MTRRIPWTLAAGLVATVAVITAAGQEAGGWVLSAPMPYERSEMAVAEAGGKIYVIGGASPGFEANTLNQEFDPATKTWRDRAPMPAIASHPGATALDGKIYIVGGFVANIHVGAMNRVFVYEPAANVWRALAPLTIARGSAGVVALNGRIHAIGGRNADGKTIDAHEVYNPATDTWTMAAPLPLGRDHLGIAAVDGRIHVFGGRTDGWVSNVNRHDVYVPSTNTWTAAAPLITARSAGVTFLMDGRIVYAGGECKDPSTATTFTEVEAYDPQGNRWTVLPALASGRHAAGGIALGAQAFLVGGNSGCGGRGPQKDVLSFRMR